MVAHLRHSVSLDQRMPTGETRREALEKVESQTGRRPKELDGPALPHACERLYGIFHELSAGRSYGMAGPAPLSHLDILAWCQLSGVRLDPWESQAIRRLDAAWMGAAAEARKEGG